MTVAEYATRWLREVEVGKKHRTAETYRANLERHWLPVFGARPLDGVTRDDVKAHLIAKREAGYGRDTTRLMLAIFRRMLNAARFEDRLITENPCDRLGHLVPRRKGPLPARALPRSHGAAILRVAETRHPKLHALFVIAARAGLRIGELLGLEWRDVDLTRGRVTVRQTVDWRLIANDPKGGAVISVPLTDQAVRVLRALRREAPRGVRWVFVGPSGRPWSRTHVRRVLHRCCQEAGVPLRSSHAFRHGFVTALGEDGVNPWVIRDLARHASIVTTEGYLHLNEAHRAVVKRLDEAG